MQIDSFNHTSLDVSTFSVEPVTSSFNLLLKQIALVALAAIALVGLAIAGYHFITRYWNRCSVQGKSIEAKAFYLKALKSDPNNFEALFNYAEYLFNQKNMAEAHPHYEKALKIRPDHLEALRHHADVLTALDYLDRAADCYQKVIARLPDDLECLKKCGDILRRRLKYKEAEALLKRALELEGLVKTPFTLSRYAETLKLLGKLQEAATHFLKAASLAPDDVFILTRYADTLRLLGEFDDALVVVNAALKLAPLDAIARTCLNKICMLRREMSPTSDLLDGVREDAKTLLKQRQYLAAEYQYVQLVSIKNQHGHADTLSHYGETLRRLNKHKEADPYFEKAVRLVPNKLFTLSRYAANLSALGQYTKALEYFDEALKHSPKDSFSLTGKADTLKKLN